MKTKALQHLVLLTIFAAFSLQASADQHKTCKRHAKNKHESEKHEMHADTNQDGKVSLEEFKAARILHMEDHFKRRDTNGDGFVDAEEKKAARAHHSKKHHGDKVCNRKKHHGHD